MTGLAATTNLVLTQATAGYVYDPICKIFTLISASTSTIPGIPADAVAVGNSTYLRPSGELYYRQKQIASAVTSAHGDYTGTWDGVSNWQISYMSGGVAYRHGTNNGGNQRFDAVPVDARAWGNAVFLTPGGALYFGNTLVAEGVTSAWGEYTGTWGVEVYLVTYMRDGQAYRWSVKSKVHTHYDQVPADAVACGNGTFLSPGGALYQTNTRLSSEATSAVGDYTGTWNGVDYYQVTYMANGKAYWWANGAVNSYASVPVDAVARGTAAFLTPRGELYFQDRLLTRGVTSAYGKFTGTSNGQDHYPITYTQAL